MRKGGRQNQIVEVEDFAQAVSEVVYNYFDAVQDGLSMLVAETAVETVQRLEQLAPKDTGEYAKNFYIRKHRNSKERTEVDIANHHYQLTHLLEHGHVQKVHGTITGFTGGKPHWLQAEREAIDKMTKGLVKIAK